MISAIAGTRDEPKATYRDDIQGLRAIGIILIVAFHIWIPRVSGGVDVLFVVSGFLMTGVLMRSHARATHAPTLSFWGRIVLRILPSALLIALITFAVGTQILPVTQWKALVYPTLASVLQVQNLHLMNTAADYLAREEAPSPFQHYWALSVQMQFFAFLPVLVALGAVLARLLRAPQAAVLATLCAGLAAASFGYGLWAAGIRPGPTYFDPAARLWEFMAGALCSLAAARWTPPTNAAPAMGWAGLALVLACGFVVPAGWAFPAPAALVPVAGAILILLGGTSPAGGGVAAVLTAPPLRAIGGYSFTIYLWHWPVLIFAMELLHRTRLSVGEGLTVITVSVALAYVTHRFVETPLRQLGEHPWLAARNRWVALAAPFALAAVMAAPLVASVAVWRAHHHRLERAYFAAVADIPAPALPIAKPTMVAGPGLEGALIAARSDLPVSYSDGCHVTLNDTTPRICRYGAAPSSGAPSVIILGGSHAAQWLPAFQDMAAQKPLTIYTATKSGCALGIDRGNRSCARWNARVLDAVIALAPDLVFTTGTRPAQGRAGDEVPAGYAKAWQRLSEAGLVIFALRDNPWSSQDALDCVARNLDDLSPCMVPRNKALSANDPLDAFKTGKPWLAVGDLSAYFCTHAICSAVSGDVLIYRDAHHITRAYVRSLRPALESLLKPFLWPGSAPEHDTVHRPVPRPYYPR